MGKVYSLLLRPIRTFNIENRAERVISKEKPKVAPQYSSTQKQIEIVDKLKPDFMKVQYEKDPQLHDYLKNVYVQSKDLKGTPKGSKDSNLSTLNKYECRETLMRIGGKCSLQNAVHFLKMYSKNPTEYSIEKISETYNLDKQIVENIVTNFKVFEWIKRETPTELDKKGRADR